MKKQSTKAFTLIELLMVIAIIGVLAGILIPTVGAVRKQANIAASKSQLSQYVNAIEMFKGEYGYYPFVTGSSDRVFNLDGNNSATFIETLSARKTNGSKISIAEARDNGNRKMIAFHSFSETEFELDANDEVSDTQLADRFGNTDINIVIDNDGNGRVTIKNKNGTDVEVKQSVSAYVVADGDMPGYSLND